MDKLKSGLRNRLGSRYFTVIEDDHARLYGVDFIERVKYAIFDVAVIGLIINDKSCFDNTTVVAGA